MKLIKCYIDNYKGIESPQIIEFEENGLTLFDGPNGYGKTTIFEVIELCLRSSIHKTRVRGNVTEDRADQPKAFYQNNIGKDVLLKTHFQNESGGDLIIIKYLPADSEGRVGNERAFKPVESLKEDILKTYRGDVSDFESNEIDTDSLEEINQQEINKFFYPDDNSIQLDKTYLLFNYLQQEENIFFLKKSEHDKRKELNFLFKTEEENAKLVQIGNFLRPIRGIKNDIETQLEKLKSQQEGFEEVEYVNFFESKELDFDTEKPFEEIELTEIEAFYERLLKKLDDLKEFLETFDVDEYSKSKKRQKLSEYIQKEDLLFAFILSKYLDPDEFGKLEELKQENSRFRSFLDSENKEKELRDFLKDFDFDEELIEEYDQSLKDLTKLEDEAGTLVSLINDLNDLRARLFDKYTALREHQHKEEEEIANCPLCGTDFESISKLQTSIEQKKKNLISAHKEKIDQISELKDFIDETFIKPVQAEMEKILSKPERQLDDEFFQIVKDHREYDEFLEELNTFLKQNEYQLDEFKISEIKTFDEVEEILDQLKDRFSELIEQIVIEQTKLKNSHLFSSYFDEDEELLELIKVQDIDKKRRYLENKYYNRKLSFSQKLEERLLLIQLVIDQYESIQEVYDDEIRGYKKRMIEKVQIPFYLISGKILKHYPQGMGIFIHFNENNNSIRFLTNTSNESYHDAVHHLSSGQLAVVSIAFCLALNKVYTVNEDFKFLAIDDPVQTMDDINTHSLIELIRHGFKDYQILISTHEDDISRYMNYKFQKFNFDVKRINVQEQFYS